MKDDGCHPTGRGREVPRQDPFLCTRSRVMGRRLPSQRALGRLLGWDSQDMVLERVTLIRTSCQPTQGQAPARDEEGFALVFPLQAQPGSREYRGRLALREEEGRPVGGGGTRGHSKAQRSGMCDPPGDERSGCGHWVRRGNSSGSQPEGHCEGLPRNPKNLNFVG